MLKDISEIHLIGYGGLGKEIEFLINSKFPHINIIPYDDNSLDYKVKKIEKLKKIQSPISCVIAIADPKAKESIFINLKDQKNINFPNIILASFDTYLFSKKNIIGVGNLIMPQSLLGFNTKIGNFNLFGVNSGLGHDVTIGDFNFIGPNTFLAGDVKIENYCVLSYGTFVLQKISLTSYVKTMPYTAVYKKIIKQGSYQGNPAKLI
jgi:acetyltransferase-like isoleucine patch superfamily enzyme